MKKLIILIFVLMFLINLPACGNNKMLSFNIDINFDYIDDKKDIRLISNTSQFADSKMIPERFYFLTLMK